MSAIDNLVEFEAMVAGSRFSDEKASDGHAIMVRRASEDLVSIRADLASWQARAERAERLVLLFDLGGDWSEEDKADLETVLKEAGQ